MTATPALPRFDDAATLVVGAGLGIGGACAERLAAEGARVAAADLDPGAARDVVDGLPHPGRHVAAGIDMTDAGSVDAAVAAAVDAFGALDVLVVAAGADTYHGTVEDIGDDVWRTMVDLNLVGAARCARAAIPHLRRSARSPSIVLISSVNGMTALGSEPYSAAKAGMISLAGNLAVSLGPDGIRANVVAPGTIRTRVWSDRPGGADSMRHLYPLGRVGEPGDVAAAVAFLASPEAAWITGVTLPVDGGLLAGPGTRVLPA